MNRQFIRHANWSQSLSHWCLSPFNTEYQFKLQADALEPCWQLTLAAVSMQSVTLVLPPD